MWPMGAATLEGVVPGGEAARARGHRRQVGADAREGARGRQARARRSWAWPRRAKGHRKAATQPAIDNTERRELCSKGRAERYRRE